MREDPVACDRVRLVLHGPAGVSPVDAARLISAYPCRSKCPRGYVIVIGDRLVRVRHGRPWCVAAPLPMPASVGADLRHQHVLVPVGDAGRWVGWVCVDCGSEW
jgi:hypothetical protein